MLDLFTAFYGHQAVYCSLRSSAIRDDRNRLHRKLRKLAETEDFLFYVRFIYNVLLKTKRFFVDCNDGNYYTDRRRQLVMLTERKASDFTWNVFTVSIYRPYTRQHDLRVN